MSYDLPFLSNAQRRASNLRPTEEELDPWGFTATPQAPRIWEPDVPPPRPVSSNVAFDAWLEQQRLETQPIIPTQTAAPTAPDIELVGANEPAPVSQP